MNAAEARVGAPYRYHEDELVQPRYWDGNVETPDKIHGVVIGRINNYRTASFLTLTHHCGKCWQRITKRCFEKDEMCWCKVLMPDGLPCLERTTSRRRVCNAHAKDKAAFDKVEAMLAAGPIELPYVEPVPGPVHAPPAARARQTKKERRATEKAVKAEASRQEAIKRGWKVNRFGGAVTFC